MNSSGSNSNDEQNDEVDDSPVERRERAAPFWMKDYVSGEGLSEEEGESNLLMFTALNDPVYFEEAVECPRWREAMELEIKAIEKNETWTFPPATFGGHIEDFSSPACEDVQKITEH